MKELLDRLGQRADRAGGRLLYQDIPGHAVLKREQYQVTASSRDMMNRVMDGSVRVIGFPALICSIQNEMTDPREHMTLPYRVQQILVLSGDTVRDLATMTFSIMALEVPIALTG